MRQNFDANGATALKKKNPLAIPQRAPPCPCRTRIDRSASSMVAPGNSNALSERRRTIACDLPTHPRLDFAEICERTGTTLCIAKTALCCVRRAIAPLLCLQLQDRKLPQKPSSIFLRRPLDRQLREYRQTQLHLPKLHTASLFARRTLRPASSSSP